jgi:hypothetical protein
MPTLNAYVANLLSSSTITFDCNGREFVFRQRDWLAGLQDREMHGKFCETTVVTVENVSETNLQQTLEEIRSICWLLSFACQSKIVCHGYDLLDADQSGQRLDVTGVVRCFRPAFEIHDSQSIKQFVEQTFANYETLKITRKLREVIHYSIQSDMPELVSEAKLVLLFVMIENLKHSFASAVQIPYISGFFRKPPQPCTKKSGRYSFEELVNMMMQAVGMNVSLSAIIDLRNKIIHSGLTGLAATQQLNEQEILHDLVREYLLRLLGYQGSYFTYSSQGMNTATIP